MLIPYSIHSTYIHTYTYTHKVNPDTGLLDYDEMEALATAFRPKLLIAGASAYPRDWDYARMRRIADKVGAQLLCGKFKVWVYGAVFLYCYV